jgi:hypothetical protein
MKKIKSISIAMLLCCFSISLKAQVPNPIINKTCGFPIIVISNKINVKCPKCCEYNTQSTNSGPGVIQHICITPTYPNCTGPFLQGKCPTCFIIIFNPADNIYNFSYATIFVAGINKKWNFDPNANNTINSENQTEKEINFIPLDNNFDGTDMTIDEINMFN